MELYTAPFYFLSMIYPKDFETKIGFDHIRNRLSALTSSRLGFENVKSMSFSSSYKKIKYELDCTLELYKIIISGISYPFPSTHDIIPNLKEIKSQNSYMPSEQLYKLLLTLISFQEVKNFYCAQVNDDKEELIYIYPALANRFKIMSTFPGIINSLSEKITKYGEVKDTASPELYDVRQAIRKSAGSMQRQMKAVLERAVKQGIIDKDTSPAIRDGRLVIPVNAGNKRDITGIVHDESATGKTIYIEPIEVVEAGNRLRELEIQEKHEIIKILRKIADDLRPETDNIENSCNLLGELDFIIAKAKYAAETNATLPHLKDRPELEWYHAVHPGVAASLKAIDKEIIPLNITLNPENRILIISGPNAGGKSVTLKTIATVQYMLQCGILPTVYENSHMGIFKKIMIDIGDEQSFENELSTYSSHLRNMRYFVINADRNTLFMADEMGSGTEPQIGGAMAQAILISLGKSGTYGIVTTHYQNLKTFADNTPGFINGAMLYDRQQLAPLFKLDIGHPGSSFAIDIAYKMGLPVAIIEDAKKIVGSEYVNIDKYLSDILRDKKYWSEQRNKIKEKQARIDSVLAMYEDETSDIKQRRKEIIEEARREAKDIVENLNAKIERTILEIRKNQAEKEKTKNLRADLKNYTEEILTERKADSGRKPDNIPGKVSRKRAKQGKKESKTNASDIDKSQISRELMVNDFVTLDNGNTIGKIINITGQKAEVVFGSLRTKVDIKRLNRSRRPRAEITDSKGIVSSKDSRDRQLNFHPEIDVRGMRADEALQAVTYFIDDAIQFNARRVRILHGTGHGILKTLIRQQLKSNGAVAGMNDEDIRFGGAGITVVDLV